MESPSGGFPDKSKLGRNLVADPKQALEIISHLRILQDELEDVAWETYVWAILIKLQPGLG